MVNIQLELQPQTEECLRKILALYRKLGTATIYRILVQKIGAVPNFPRAGKANKDGRRLSPMV